MWEDKTIEPREFPNYEMPYEWQGLMMDTDSYKPSHAYQYPDGTTSLFDYIESRGGRYGETVFFGLQYILKQYFCSPVTRAQVEFANKFFPAHGEPFPYEGWMRIVEKHGGRLPLRIRAVPEGTIVPVRNVLVTVESLDPEIPWIASWMETQLMRLWYPVTVATKSYYCKKTILEALIKSADDPIGEIYFKLHDFGSRGVSSRESAGIGGAAHLVNFQGSDTVWGVLTANHFYNIDMAAFSIPASEHSTMTILSEKGELAQMRRMIQKFGRSGAIFACVSDSYNIYRAVEEYWCDELYEELKASGATLVIRPDSGDPVEVNLKLLRLLERKVGMRTNMKGYKVLPKCIRLIQGDGNRDEDSIKAILDAIMEAGYSASNIAFGMGGGLLQLVDRDTQKFAMKCSEAVINNEVFEVRKNPITDPGKQSKAGRLDLVHRNGEYQTVQGDQPDSVLQTVYEFSRLLIDQNMEDIRKRAEVGLNLN